ncbi:MAG TPA: hypothetical protein VLC95_14535, partial [Anaerolineae bacterium]|nr:hypothetical protein [Anaerolineae bacterium]
MVRGTPSGVGSTGVGVGVWVAVGVGVGIAVVKGEDDGARGQGLAYRQVQGQVGEGDRLVALLCEETELFLELGRGDREIAPEDVGARRRT